ncbi:MAG: M23 family metallopeptidase [Alphaproteobacteria bacterium]|nr:MAG: M23 family metallopeptidase [Alphaproteobacteria bacterium]
MKTVFAGFVMAMATGAVWAAGPDISVVRQAPVQGGFLVAKVPAGSNVKLDGKPISVGPDGQIVVGFDREAKGAAVLNVCDAQNACAKKTVKIGARVFKTQNVTGIPPKTVDPDPAQVARTEADSKATQDARNKANEAAKWRSAFMDGFKLPVEAPTSGVYGSRRTYNGQERSWHKGHDLAAKTGTPVKAPADGIVRLARDTFMSGNLIMLDHGGALTTVYAHLNSMDVKVGDSVKAGDVIGTVGTTGRSSGPHLHWGAYWKNTAIDPILWVAK